MLNAELKPPDVKSEKPHTQEFQDCLKMLVFEGNVLVKF
jgi:hypothetical protein